MITNLANITKKISNFLWVFPFFSFLFGYYLLHFLLQKQEVSVPNIIGKSLQSSMIILSRKGLSLQLLREQEDPDLPEGIILDQVPKPNQKIKSNQHIFITISKKPKMVLAPDFLGQSQKYISNYSTKSGIQTKIFWLKSFYSINNCFAQYPQPGQDLVNAKLITYLSLGNEKLHIVPNLKGCKACDLQQRFLKDNVKVEVFHKKKVDCRHVCEDCVVIDQKPMPGSIVDLGKNLFLQVQVD